MAAATSTATTANKRSFKRKITQNTIERMNLGTRPQGLYAFDSGASAVATTNIDDTGDQLWVLKFPDGAYLVDLQVTLTDLDNGGTALVLDHLVENDAGTEVVLINDSTTGQAAGSDELDADGGHLLRDVGGMFLGFRCVTAAGTPAAGTVRYKGLIWMGAPLTSF